MSLGASSIHSDVWHRMSNIKPRLRPETIVERQIVRGQVWYVASDRFATRAYRFTPAVWSVLMRMDGRRTLDRIWREVADRSGADAPAQDQILSVISQLYTAELISSNRPVDLDEAAERGENFARRLTAQRYQNPMFIRLPLIDPDRFLSATVHLVRPFCGMLGALLWLAAVSWFLVEVALHWGELTDDVKDRVLATDSILVFLLTFPPLKIMHELGHAYAVKLLGGPVHEIGISLLTFMPAPYVDASAAALFPSRWQRAAVGAAGMIVELAAAVLALVIWLFSEPGLIRSIAYDVVFIASVSTVVFNANPLLRFDGYYIVGDALGLPNLAVRSQRLYMALIQRDLFGMRSVTLPTPAPGETFWLLLYAPASLAYRMVVVTGIALFVGTQYFFFGVALVIWMLVTTILWPVLKGFKYILLSPALTGRRIRAIGIVGGSLVAIILAITLVPIPRGTVTQGVVWIPEDSRVVADVSGEVQRFLAESGTPVQVGTPLIELSDPFILSKRLGAEARLHELEARQAAAEPHSASENQLLRSQIEFAASELAEADRRVHSLVLRSPASGVFLVPRQTELLGSYVKQGELLGYVMTGETPVVRTAVPEEDIDLVRSQIKGVDVKVDGAAFVSIDGAEVIREFPAATHKLPSKSLASANGGPFALDPADKDQNTSLLPFFTVDIKVSPDLVRNYWGERAWIRFDHGASPLAERWWRSIRQIFLGRFHV